MGNLILLSFLSSVSVVDTGGKFTDIVTGNIVFLRRDVNTGVNMSPVLNFVSVNYAILSLPPVVLLIQLVHLEL